MWSYGPFALMLLLFRCFALFAFLAQAEQNGAGVLRRGLIFIDHFGSEVKQKKLMSSVVL